MTPTRWVDPGYKNPRSARINDAAWDRHKKLLCTLYKSYPLADVMTFMEIRHGFKPSKRQYGYRFQKWGIKKYNSGNGRALARPMAEMDSFLKSQMRSSSPGTPLFLDIPRTGYGYPSPGSSYAASDIDVGSFDEDSEAEGKISLLQTPVYSVLYAWTAREAKTKLAADFCFVMSDDANAFGIYHDLYDCAMKKSEANTAAKDMLVISCARAAEHAENAKTASKLLDDHPFRRRGEAGGFIFAILVAFLKERDGEADKADARKAICDIMDEFLTRNSRSGLPRRCEVLDVVGYQCLSQGLGIHEAALLAADQNPTFSSDHTLISYVKKQLLLDIPSRCHILRSCVNWCATQLRHAPVIPPAIQTIRPSPSQRLWCDNIYVFCALWDSMLREIAHKANQPPWYSDAEPALGICPSELLITICWMIGDEARVKDPDGTVIQRAAIGAKAMTEWQEGDLWIEFLRKFTWMNKIIDPQPEEKEFEAVVLSHVRKYISSALGVRLPVAAQEAIPVISYPDQIRAFSPSAGDDIFTAFDDLSGTGLFPPEINMT